MAGFEENQITRSINSSAPEFLLFHAKIEEKEKLPNCKETSKESKAIENDIETMGSTGNLTCPRWKSKDTKFSYAKSFNFNFFLAKELIAKIKERTNKTKTRKSKEEIVIGTDLFNPVWPI